MIGQTALLNEKRDEEKKKKRKKEPKEPQLKGSIKVARNNVFFEKRPVNGVKIEYEGITATMIPSCLSEELRAIFKKLEKLGLYWDTTKNDKPKTVKEITGLVFDEIVEVDEEYLRIRFSANTPSEFESRRDKLVAYFNKLNIDYGETDGSIVCIWVCVAKGRQTELTDEYIERLDRLRRAQK